MQLGDTALVDAVRTGVVADDPQVDEHPRVERDDGPADAEGLSSVALLARVLDVVPDEAEPQRGVEGRGRVARIHGRLISNLKDADHPPHSAVRLPNITRNPHANPQSISP